MVRCVPWVMKTDSLQLLIPEQWGEQGVVGALILAPLCRVEELYLHKMYNFPR